MNVIIPAAGQGTRLGLPYPKELHRITEGRSLIDFSLDHIQVAAGRFGEVVLVTLPEKAAVAAYVRGQLADVPVIACPPDPRYSEWAGSILSAEPHFAERNLVLLPDSRISLPDERTLAEHYEPLFDAGHDVVFAVKKVAAAAELERLGALRLEGSLVTDFCDKPDPAEAPAYNAYWASFGFTRRAGPPLLKMMMRSVARERVDIGSLGLSIAAFEIADYVDLGTWPAIRRFLGEKGRQA